MYELAQAKKMYEVCTTSNPTDQRLWFFQHPDVICVEISRDDFLNDVLVYQPCKSIDGHGKKHQGDSGFRQWSLFP